MGTTMSGVVECWHDKTQYYEGHWDNVAEVEFNKWYELQETIWGGKFEQPKADSMSWAVRKVIHEDVSRGFYAIPFERLEKLWEGFDSTAMATVEFMRVMEACGYPTRLVVYFS